MTEHEWLTCADPGPMLEFLRGKAIERKLRLFACACCRRAAEAAPRTSPGGDPDRGRVWRDIRAAERLADDPGATPADGLEHNFGFLDLFHESAGTLAWAAHAATDPDGWGAAAGSVRQLADATWGDGDAGWAAACLRDVLGNPFRPVTADPTWFSPTGVSLADAIYADRAFDRLPVLADALEEAGCDNADVLSHCRGDGGHVRGCWVIDLLLGKG